MKTGKQFNGHFPSLRMKRMQFEKLKKIEIHK